jgi:DNA-binding NarL/FixJ family response regulator
MDDPIRILIADDHQIFRDGLKMLLETEPGFQLVGEAETGIEAVRLASELKPDVILMDLQMPGTDGIEAVRQIMADRPEIKILMLTMFDDDHSVFAAMRAGARGYVLKGMRRNEMLRAIWSISEGEAIFSPGIASRMIDFFSKLQPPSAAGLFPELTVREREVLALLARDYKNSDIAQELVLSVKTVRNHVSSILTKLQASSRAEAARRARDAGLG